MAACDSPVDFKGRILDTNFENAIEFCKHTLRHHDVNFNYNILSVCDALW